MQPKNEDYLICILCIFSSFSLNKAILYKMKNETSHLAKRDFGNCSTMRTLTHRELSMIRAGYTCLS